MMSEECISLIFHLVGLGGPVRKLSFYFYFMHIQ